MKGRKGRLGIMVTERDRTPPFSNQHFYRRLCLIGNRHGLIVFVFPSERIDWASGTVIGYTVRHPREGWIKKRFPLPDLIYDRCFFTGRREYLAFRSQIRKLRRMSRITFLGHGLPGKWRVNEMLAGDEELAPYLPPMEKAENAAVVREWLNEHGEVFLKPQGGSQGRGAMRIGTRDEGRHRYVVSGRDDLNRVFRYGFTDFERLGRWLGLIFRRRNYVMQPYLQLSTPDGEPCDIRSFVQKNKHGRWQLIGTALRVGRRGALTSNLHGGGRAEETLPFLTRHYGESAAGIIERIHSLTLRAAETLESRHGRLVELGVDFGVDRAGRIWILEVNSKPGRTVFARISDRAASRLSLVNPIHYARYLWDRQLGG